MQDKYILTFHEAIKAIQENAGYCTCILLVNGEYYDINPDTVPKTEKPDFLKDLLRG